MKIDVSLRAITINGNIKSVDDFQEIKNAIDKIVVSGKDVALNIIDSISITSSVIIYLKELILNDNINVQINAGKPALIELLDDLKLTSVFRAKKSIEYSQQKISTTKMEN